MMNRRNFIQQSALAGSVIMISPADLLKTKAKHIGVQVYSVRDFADKDPEGTFRKLAEIGYKEIEGHTYADGRFYTWTPKEYKTLLKEIGLCMPSAHTGINLTHWDSTAQSLTDATKKNIDSHAELGVKQLICPYIEEKYRGLEDVKRLCDILNHVGEACKKTGIQFGYHNHEFEFVKAEGKYIMDHILERTEPDLVVMEMDLYWVAYANENPIEWIKKYAGRISSFHVKDLADTPKRETVEVGEGTIDFAKIFSYSKLAGVKYYIVELEHYKRTSLEGVAISLQNLKTILSS